MAFEYIRTERDGAVLRVILDRPERLNAAPPAMFDEIAGAVRERGGARAVLLIGAGRAFCSGADMAAAGQAMGGNRGEASYAALVDHYNPAIQTILELDVPVVSAVRGPAAGIGCSLALAADLCVASDTAYFLQAFVNVGLVPDGGASWMLPRLIGRARASQMMLLGDRVPALTARDWGMVYSVVSDDVLEVEALALARRLADGPTVALGLTRGNLLAGLDGDHSAALLREAEAQRHACGMTDAAEGAAAFLGKRKPDFTGS